MHNDPQHDLDTASSAREAVVVKRHRLCFDPYLRILPDTIPNVRTGTIYIESDQFSTMNGKGKNKDKQKKDTGEMSSSMKAEVR